MNGQEGQKTSHTEVLLGKKELPKSVLVLSDGLLKDTVLQEEIFADKYKFAGVSPMYGGFIGIALALICMIGANYIAEGEA